MSLRRPLSESVVVVTGASGGIGAATAECLAERGTRVVLAARRPDALEEIASRCLARGGEALAVPSDVTDPAAVEALAEAATGRFGRIDAWVNNAAVALYAPLVGARLDEVRRVVDVNVFGYLHGIRSAVPRLRAAGGGVIVNVASVLAEMAVPYLGAYTLTKSAVRALSDTVRQELVGEPISVCTVLPASVDTPLYEHAGNRSGRVARPIPPVYSPDTVARVILRVLRRPRRVAYAGGLGRLGVWQWHLAPGLTERAGALVGPLVALGDEPRTPTAGNLFTPVPGEPASERGRRQ